MLYLVTDTTPASFSTDNPNFYVPAYKNLKVAAYMYPCYEGVISPKFWSFNGNIVTNIVNEEAIHEGIQVQCDKLDDFKEIELQLPTNEQKIAFGLVSTFNVVQNPTYKKWVIDYLAEIDLTKETAQKVSELLIEEKMSDTILPLFQKIDCCHAAIASVLYHDPSLFAANAAHRAYYFSLQYRSPINLEQIIQIVEMLPGKEIAEMLK